MRQVWIVALVGLVAVSALSCKKKRAGSKAKESAKQEVVRREATLPRPEGAKRLRPKLSRRAQRRIEPITVDEMTAVFATPEGARVLTKPAKPAQGERVQATYCFESTDATAAATALQTALEGKGWTNVHLRQRPEQPDRAALAAQQPPYRISASIRKIPAPKCNGDAGHSYATVTLHKINAAKAVVAPAGQRWGAD